MVGPAWKAGIGKSPLEELRTGPAGKQDRVPPPPTPAGHPPLTPGMSTQHWSLWPQRELHLPLGKLRAEQSPPSAPGTPQESLYPPEGMLLPDSTGVSPLCPHQHRECTLGPAGPTVDAPPPWGLLSPTVRAALEKGLFLTPAPSQCPLGKPT